MQLHTLLASLEQPPVAFHNVGEQGEHIEIAALAYDSRQIAPGGLFIAVPGTHTDGRSFLADAAQRGAVAALGPQTETSDLPLPYIEVDDVRITLANLASAFTGTRRINFARSVLPAPMGRPRRAISSAHCWM